MALRRIPTVHVRRRKRVGVSDAWGSSLCRRSQQPIAFAIRISKINRKIMLPGSPTSSDTSRHARSRRLVSLYVYRVLSYSIGRLPTAIISFSSIFKSPAGWLVFWHIHVLSRVVPQRWFSLGRVQVASQGIYLHNAIWLGDGSVATVAPWKSWTFLNFWTQETEPTWRTDPQCISGASHVKSMRSVDGRVQWVCGVTSCSDVLPCHLRALAHALSLTPARSLTPYAHTHTTTPLS